MIQSLIHSLHGADPSHTQCARLLQWHILGHLEAETRVGSEILGESSRVGVMASMDEPRNPIVGSERAFVDRASERSDCAAEITAHHFRGGKCHCSMFVRSVLAFSTLKGRRVISFVALSIVRYLGTGRLTVSRIQGDIGDFDEQFFGARPGNFDPIYRWAPQGFCHVGVHDGLFVRNFVESGREKSISTIWRN